MLMRYIVKLSDNSRLPHDAPARTRLATFNLTRDILSIDIAKGREREGGTDTDAFVNQVIKLPPGWPAPSRVNG